MFRKVHYLLTLLCAGITASILLVMSLIYLYVSETSLTQSQFLSFQHAMDNLINNFRQQRVINHEWLAQTEKNNACSIRITDNGIPLLFSQKKEDPVFRQTEEEALDYFYTSFAVGNLPDEEEQILHFTFLTFKF